MNRRMVMLGAIASTLPVPALAQTDEPLALERLITEVVAGGDVSVLPDLVAEDASLPDFNVAGIDALTAATESGHQNREKRYSEYEFTIQAIAESGDWQLAYVRLTGTTTEGQSEDIPGFYAARLVDGLIAELFIGQ